ncbi:MAG: nucleotidyltransferase family protein [Flavobacteriaceae bacterium]|jgi:molybdenum cofactor cytidylyltransferase|nr:nucleotidyltransferase family protein [Flavobacteriaceae bacterium]MCB0484953.1 nucleotidyltransferase family protein [Flavobacteriaceae bacterium]
MSKIVHLLIAAGESKRMKQPKQLLSWGNNTLIEHQIHTLLGTNQDVIVILGAYADEIFPVIKDFPIKIVTNKQWAKGMGTSIAYGIEMLWSNFPNTDGVLISLIDQPLVTNHHFEKMINRFEPEKRQIIVSRSTEGWTGVPVLFDTYYFDALQKLCGEEGAKKIIRQENSNVVYIDAANLLTDMDTPEVYRELHQKFLSN